MENAPRHQAHWPRSGWSYRRAAMDDVVDFGTVRGRDVALPAHFHDEDQITVVRFGRRRFVIGGTIISVEAGGCALIRAGVVHRSLVEPDGVDGFNLYMPAGDYAWDAMMSAVERLWRETLEPTALVTIVRTHRLRWTEGAPTRIVSRGSVAERAARIGLSREGFSRAFTREHGMPPRPFGLVTRLNHARRLLRQGAPLVDAALDTGFADQSHLGRCFRRAFGVTPGQYRDGERRDGPVTNVPDAAVIHP